MNPVQYTSALKSFIDMASHARTILWFLATMAMKNGDFLWFTSAARPTEDVSLFLVVCALSISLWEVSKLDNKKDHKHNKKEQGKSIINDVYVFWTLKSTDARNHATPNFNITYSININSSNNSSRLLS